MPHSSLFRAMAHSQSSIYMPEILISSSIECEGELFEIEGFLKAMEVEVNAMLSSEKQHSQKKLEGYADEYKQARQISEELKIASQTAARKNGYDTATRIALMVANERLDISTRSLQQSKNVVCETEMIGDQIVSDLEDQREKLIGAGGNIKETRRSTLDAKKVLNLMGYRALTHRFFLTFIFVLLLIFIWMLIYYGILRKKW